MNAGRKRGKAKTRQNGVGLRGQGVMLLLLLLLLLLWLQSRLQSRGRWLQLARSTTMVRRVLVGVVVITTALRMAS